MGSQSLPFIEPICYTVTSAQTVALAFPTSAIGVRKMWLIMWSFFAIAVITSFVLWCALRLNRCLDDCEEMALKRTGGSDDQRRAG